MDPPASPRHFQPFYPDIPSQINLQQHLNSSVPLRHDPDQSSRPVNHSSSASSTYSKSPMDDPTTYTNPPPSLHPTAQRHAFTVDSQKALLKEVIDLQPYLNPDRWDAVTNRYAWWCYHTFNPKRKMVPKDRLRKKVKSILTTYHQKRPQVSNSSASASVSHASASASASAEYGHHLRHPSNTPNHTSSESHTPEPSNDDFAYDAETIKLIEQVVKQYTESTGSNSSRRASRVHRPPERDHNPIPTHNNSNITNDHILSNERFSSNINNTNSNNINRFSASTSSSPTSYSSTLPSIHSSSSTNASASTTSNPFGNSNTNPNSNSNPIGNSSTVSANASAYRPNHHQTTYSTPLGIHEMINNTPSSYPSSPSSVKRRRTDNPETRPSSQPFQPRRQPSYSRPSISLNPLGNMADLLSNDDALISPNSSYDPDYKNTHSNDQGFQSSATANATINAMPPSMTSPNKNPSQNSSSTFHPNQQQSDQNTMPETTTATASVKTTITATNSDQCSNGQINATAGASSKSSNEHQFPFLSADAQSQFGPHLSSSTSSAQASPSGQKSENSNNNSSNTPVNVTSKSSSQSGSSQAQATASAQVNVATPDQKQDPSSENGTPSSNQSPSVTTTKVKAKTTTSNPSDQYPSMPIEFTRVLREILEDNNRAKVEMMKEFGMSFGTALGTSLGASLSSAIKASIEKITAQTTALQNSASTATQGGTPGSAGFREYQSKNEGGVRDGLRNTVDGTYTSGGSLGIKPTAMNSATDDVAPVGLPNGLQAMNQHKQKGENIGRNKQNIIYDDDMNTHDTNHTQKNNTNSTTTNNNNSNDYDDDDDITDDGNREARTLGNVNTKNIPKLPPASSIIGQQQFYGTNKKLRNGNYELDLQKQKSSDGERSGSFHTLATEIKGTVEAQAAIHSQRFGEKLDKVVDHSIAHLEHNTTGGNSNSTNYNNLDSTGLSLPSIPVSTSYSRNRYSNNTGMTQGLYPRHQSFDHGSTGYFSSMLPLDGNVSGKRHSDS